MKRKLMLIGGGGLVFASSFPMIAASCDVKKKDVETSNSEKQDPKTNPESNSANQDSKTKPESNSGNQNSKTDSESNSEKQDPKTNPESNSANQDSKTKPESNSGNQNSKTDSESNSGKQDSKPNSESNSEKQDSKPNSESNSGNQGSKTNGSSNESTRPSENTQNDMSTKNSEINTYLNKVKEYGKETSEFATLLMTLEKTEEAKELLMKSAKFGPVVKELFKFHESLKSDFEKTKKEIEDVIGDPRSKNKLLDILKQYEKSRNEIKNAIEKLKGLKKEK
ncbi:hypothetical protein FCL87_00420 [Mycoplasma bovis]|uniref:Mbov_0283/Mbov_0339 family surface lipoprotein n=1 Tax=Mycoplasmopsis bovis TaxID=28903 RepID=UPI001BDF4234|nr:hypothetical protein [Mycoplasmopsis bovis]MBT1328562.1 hypothetical protein [Mycoplasmopsis bovis]UJB28601.1 hypothetical protein FG866_03765 [Mycoplasmopsis bovis]